MTHTKTRIAINGFGRIGRQFLRIALDRPELEIVAVNDPGELKGAVQLFEFDSTYGRLNRPVEIIGEEAFKVSGQTIKKFADRDPKNLPWKDLKIDVVVECTGVFCDREGASQHLTAGAKRVIISAPAKSNDIVTIVEGVNDHTIDLAKEDIISNASCTTNCLAPVLKVLCDAFGVEQGSMVTIHAYTNDQRILDLAHKDPRRARTAGINMIPTTTGAAKAVGLVIPELKGKLDGYSVRVPTITVSLVDLTVILKKAATREEVNQAFIDASNGRLKGILMLETRPLVSCDFKGESHSSIVDAEYTRTDGKLCHVTAWYDNEWGYTMRLVDLVAEVGGLLE